MAFITYLIAIVVINYVAQGLYSPVAGIIFGIFVMLLLNAIFEKFDEIKRPTKKP